MIALVALTVSLAVGLTGIAAARSPHRPVRHSGALPAQPGVAAAEPMPVETTTSLADTTVPPSDPAPPTTAAPLTSVSPRRAPSTAAAAPPPVVKQPPPRPNRVDPSPAPPPSPGSTAVYADDAPDPFVFHAGSWWYALTTQHGVTNVPILRSADLQHWEPERDALPHLPQWAEWGSTWAPTVMPRGPQFVLYYTTRYAATRQQCISVATSLLPDGPYLDTSSGPLVCQTDRGGSIDASPFLDAGGHPWLTWGSLGTTDGEPTAIWSVALTDDGLAVADTPHQLLAPSFAWEASIVEGPSMLVDGDTYHLLFSANRWETSDYAVGHAVCAGPAGPCTPQGSPILATSSVEAGPGGAEFFRNVDGRPMVAYHAWDPDAVGYPAGARRLHIAKLALTADTVAIDRSPL